MSGEPTGSDTHRKLILDVLPGDYAVARLWPQEPVPAWASGGDLVVVARTAQELSIVCRAESVPSGETAQRGMRCLRVQGPLEFSEIGILASLAGVLAKSRIGLFAVSTYETDYLLVDGDDLARAVAAISAAGHTVRREPD